MYWSHAPTKEHQIIHPPLGSCLVRSSCTRPWVLGFSPPSRQDLTKHLVPRCWHGERASPNTDPRDYVGPVATGMSYRRVSCFVCVSSSGSSWRVFVDSIPFPHSTAFDAARPTTATTFTPTSSPSGPMTRARAKLLQAKVTSPLSLCDFDTPLDGL